MALFVYASDVMKADAKTQGISLEKVQQFCDEVEGTQSLSTFDRFPPPYLTRKKKWQFSNRIIAAEHTVRDHLIVVLLRLVVKGSRDYEHQFTVNPDAYASPYLEAAIPHAEEWLAERTRVAPPPEMPKPSQTQQHFLWSEVGPDDESDALICETDRWIQSCKDSRVANRLPFVPNLILDLVGGANETLAIASPQNEPSLTVAYRWLPATRQLLLLDVACDQSLNAERCWTAATAGMPAGASFDPLRITRRSYPVDICCDTDMWLAIQRDDAANLALSPEEGEILRSVRTTQAATGFPLFINGRAGSGKSTILQYLFTDYFSAWARHVMRGNAVEPSSIPLYLASSDDLLATAESAVRGLLRANAARMLRDGSIEDKVLQQLHGAFRKPVGYFLEFVARAEEADAFDSSRYVNYPQFRRLWLDQFGQNRQARRDFGPQLSWHVIRTHIKGQSADSELEPEDYRALPRNELTVSFERFKTIYNRVWNHWYAPICKSERYWDDQDLAARAVAMEYQGKHVALFCDESQDFTRRELDALHRCCAFSFLQLSPEEASRVPFAFAGDPFQTLNPTGFRWEAIRAAFTEKIAGNLYRYRRRSQLPEINYRELTYNYRSGPNIVRLCNSIQAIRSLIMAERHLRPQTTWHLDATASLPMFYHTSDAAIQKNMRDHTDLVLVVPCEDDGEMAYLDQHPSVRAIVRIASDNVPENVLSPARAKGLEFDRVAVVGFGSEPEALEIQRCVNETDYLRRLSSEALLPIEYYLNKLYVACSRARRRLFIIDDPEHLETLWGFALDSERLENLCRRLVPDEAAWRNCVGHVAKGLPEHWQQDQNDPLETAQRFEADGQAKQDSYLLLQAALQYEHAGQDGTAADCRGRAYRLERQPVKAGGFFLKAGKWEQAVESFWEGEQYGKVVDVVNRDSTLQSRVEYRLSSVLQDGKGERGGAHDLLQEIVDLGSGNRDVADKFGRKGWSRAIRDLTARALASARSAGDVARWMDLATVLGRLVDLGVSVDNSTRAETLVGARQFDAVVDLLKARRDSEFYRIAKMETLRVRRHGGKGSFAPDEMKLAGDVLRSRGEFGEALWWLTKAADRAGIEACFMDLAEGRGDDNPEPFLRALVELGAAKGDWEYTLDLAMGKAWRGLTRRGQTVLRDIWQRLDLTQRVLEPAVAVSKSVLQAKRTTREKICELVRRAYLGGSGAWDEARARAARWHGAAIERVGKDIEALDFYEGLFNSDECPMALKEYSQRRWIHCKLRQEARERGVGRRQHADKYKEQAEGRLRAFDWRVQDLGPKYPDRGLLEQAGGKSGRAGGASEVRRIPQSSAGENKWRCGALTFEVFGVSSRINVHSDLGEQARIDLRSRRLSSDEVGVEERAGGVWFVEAWDLRAVFSADRNVLQLSVHGEEREIELDDTEPSF